MAAAARDAVLFDGPLMGYMLNLAAIDMCAQHGDFEHGSHQATLKQVGLLLAAAGQTCSTWKGCMSTDHFWRSLTHAFFSTTANLVGVVDWKGLFARRHHSAIKKQIAFAMKQQPLDDVQFMVSVKSLGLATSVKGADAQFCDSQIGDSGEYELFELEWLLPRFTLPNAWELAADRDGMQGLVGEPSELSLSRTNMAIVLFRASDQKTTRFIRNGFVDVDVDNELLLFEDEIGMEILKADAGMICFLARLVLKHDSNAEAGSRVRWLLRVRAMWVRDEEEHDLGKIDFCRALAMLRWV